jgi:hypothetical protein
MTGDRPVHEVVARRVQGWWAVEIPGLPGVFTQARSLDQVEDMARDAIAVFLDVPATSIAVVVRCIPPAEARAEVEQAIAFRAEAERAQASASASLRRAIAALTNVGLSNRDAGRLLGVSHQRIAQLSGSKRRDRERTASPDKD